MTTSQTNLDNDIIMSSDLSPVQQRAIFCLLETKTIEQAADCTGVSSRTLHRWLRTPEFLSELQSIQNGVMHETSLRLIGLQSSVLDRLESLMNNSCDERVQLAAAESIQNYILRWYELTHISVRLAEMENSL